MKAAVLTDVRQIVSDILNVDPSLVGEESGPDSIESWDSLQHLNIVLALEQKFGISLTPADIQGMTSVRTLVDIVERAV
jgi:acyl carrier protein